MSEDNGVACKVEILFMDDKEIKIRVGNPNGITNARIDKASRLIQREFMRVRGKMRMEMKKAEQVKLQEAKEALLNPVPLPDPIVEEKEDETDEDLKALDDFLACDDPVKEKSGAIV